MKTKGEISVATMDEEKALEGGGKINRIQAEKKRKEKTTKH